MDIKNQKAGNNSILIQTENLYINNSPNNIFDIEIHRLCYEVLMFIKNNTMRISEEQFKNICGAHVDDVLEELKSQNIGSFAPSYKSIWSINKKQLHLGLNYYKI